MAKNKKDLETILFKNEQKKSTLNTRAEANYRLSASKVLMSNICSSLIPESPEYFPETTVKLIQEYLKEDRRLERFLYSQISNIIIGLDEKQRGKFSSNVEELMIYVEDESNSLSDDVKKLCIKIYDHFQLNLVQMENMNTISVNSLENEHQKLHDQLKIVEKDYITILGIFAAIVLSFTGGMTLSGSVLENINKASIFRISFIVLLLGFILFNILFLLFKFIASINEKEFAKDFVFWTINGLLIAMILGILGSYAYKYNWFEPESDLANLFQCDKPEPIVEIIEPDK